METELRIRADKKTFIYASLRYPTPQPKTALVLIHGLAGDRNEAKNMFTAQLAVKHQIAAVLLSLYSWQKDARRLDQTSMQVNLRDIESTLCHLRKRGFKKLFMAAHSLAGPTVLACDQTLYDGLILWDPTSPALIQQTFGTFNRSANSYMVDWGYKILLGKRINKERKKFPHPLQLIATIKKPILICTAKKGDLLSSGRDYFAAAHGPKKHLIFKNAGHNFDEGNSLDRLAKVTVDWCKKYEGDPS